eukprot:365011-Chlamydomonas_euryale.AAC.12
MGTIRHAMDCYLGHEIQDIALGRLRRCLRCAVAADIKERRCERRKSHMRHAFALRDFRGYLRCFGAAIGRTRRRRRRCLGCKAAD